VITGSDLGSRWDDWTLTTYSLKRTLVASLKQEPSLAQELALLYRVELSGIGSDRFRLIGLEKVVSGREVAWVNQCWVCRVDGQISSSG
jgi:hypothetical protein